MKITASSGKKIAVRVLVEIWQYIFLITSSYLLLYPFLYIAIGSFKGSADFFDPTVMWVPKHITLSNITAALKALDFGNGFKSTLYYQIVAALLECCSCAMAAYGIARFKFKGKLILECGMFLNILVPVTMIIIPSYVNFQYIDLFGILGFVSKLVGRELRPSLIDTPFVFWIPSALGVGLKGGLFVYIYTQFFKSLPKELEEAAWIDGAGPIKTFLRIIIPSSGSTGIVILIFSVIWHYSDYYLSQMYLSDNFPLGVKLNQLKTGISGVLENVVGKTASTQEAVLLASCFLFLIPLLVFYVCVQRKFITGIATTGLVG